MESQFTLHPEFEAFSSARHQMSVRRRISGSFSLHWGILGMVFIMALAIGLLKTVREYRKRKFLDRQGPIIDGMTIQTEDSVKRSVLDETSLPKSGTPVKTHLFDSATFIVI